MTKLKVAMITLVLVAAADAVPIFLQYQENLKLKQENLELREQTAQLKDLERVREENAQLTKKQSEASKDLLELVRLRGEVGTLKRQVVEAGKVREENAQLRLRQTQVQAAPQPAAALQPAVLMPTVPQPQQGDAAQQSCIANMKQLEGAKQQWALENKKAATDMPTFQDLIGETKYIRVMPVCPAGGQYILNAIQQLPQCSIPSHRLP